MIWGVADSLLHPFDVRLLLCKDLCEDLAGASSLVIVDNLRFIWFSYTYERT